MAPWSVSLFRLLLAVYPRRFRYEYGAEMERVFQDRLKATGGVARIGLWAHTLVDLAVTAAGERLEVLSGAARLAASSPVLPVAAAAALTVAVGVSSGLFHSIRVLVVRPADRLVAVYERGSSRLRAADFFDWRGRDQVFEASATVEPARVFRAAAMIGTGVSPELFGLLGTQPALGRLPAVGEGRAAVLSYDTFAGRFRGEGTVIGRTLALAGESFTIVGVLPRDFAPLPYTPDVWLPDGRGSPDLYGVVGRLKPGVERKQAELAMRVFAPGVRVASLEEDSQPNLRPALAVLMAALAAALLIAAVNVVRHRSGLGYWAFFVAKTSIALLLPAGLWLFAGQALGIFAAGGSWSRFSVLLALWSALLVCFGVICWSLIDQRGRCRACLRPLRMPVSKGSWASLVMDRPGTHYICAYGHGKLYVPGTRLLPVDSVTWTVYGNFWQELERC